MGIEPNFQKIKENLNNSLMLITCLNNKLGYEKCAQIAKNIYNNSTLKEESIKLGYLTDKEFNELVDLKKCVTFRSFRSLTNFLISCSSDFLHINSDPSLELIYPFKPLITHSFISSRITILSFESYKLI